jgi:DNA-directed RNA polymerase beta subunit
MADGLPEGLREFDDAKATRKLIYDNVLSAVQKRFPVEDDNYRLELLDARYGGPQEYTLAQQKNAILRNRNLRTPIVGKWRLTDKKTGQVLDEREDQVMQVPYWTDRGTIINNGSEYTVITQSRLRPGVYARRKTNGGLEAQFNIDPRTGHSFRIGLNQQTGVFDVSVGQGHIPLYQVLRGLGVDDKEIIRNWGADLTAANAQKSDPQAWRKLYERMAGYRADPNLTDADRMEYVRNGLTSYKVDPDIVERTMGLRNVSGVTPQLLMRASQKLLNISRGDEKPDNRDNPRFSAYYSIEDFLKERVDKDAGRLTKSLLFRARRNRNLKGVRRDALAPYVDAFIQGSGLAMPGEEANPLSTLEQMSRISKFGEGGIQSEEAVTMSAREVNGDYLGFVDPVAGPESGRIGVDVRATYHTYKGKDNKIYGEFLDAKTGKTAYVDIGTAADRKIAFPGQDMSKPYVYIMKDGVPQMAPTSEVQYIVPNYGRVVGSNTNMNPFPTAVQPNRQFYASKFWTQYLPQAKGEVPLVDSLMPDGKQTWSEYYGRKVGAVKSDVDGVVTRVTDDSVTIKDNTGKTHKVELVKNLPFNRLSGISFSPSVEVGQDVKSGDMIAHSNFTDKKTGAINMGQNLHAAIIPYRGYSFEDAHVISESAAKRLATDRLYSFDHDSRNGVILDKKKYISAFPSKFTKDQIETLDDNGLVKPGTILHRGDPIVTSLGPKVLTSSDKALGKLSKALRNSYTDRTETWEHDYEGKVVDAVRTAGGAKVNVVAQPPVRAGDKLSGRFGLKGVVGKVVPDDEMPRDATTNQPYDMLINPMGFLSRVAPGQIMEMAMGKVAKATGKQVRIPQLPPPEGWYEWTKNQLAQNNLTDSANVFDPTTGKTINNIGDGYLFISAFHHLAEKKESMRGAGDAAYTQDEQPAKGGKTGAKRSSGLDNWAMLSHGATDVLKDAVLIRGTRNDNYWNSLKLGLPLPEPESPFIYKKFLNTLRAGGINVVEKGNITKIIPQTDKDVEQLANGRVISSSEMVDSSFDPVKGGLFDLGKTGGMAGNQWSMIELPEPVPNPIMEEPVRRVLGLTVSKMEDVLAGREKIDGKTGGEALKSALAKVDVDKKIADAKRDILGQRGAKRDDAVKVYRYLTAMKEQGLSPQDWMVSKVPVIPPAFRPVSKMGDVALVSDMNDLYKDIIENANNFRELKKDVSDEGVADERINIYNSVKAAYGLGQPITPENAAKGVKGALRQVIGSSPKFGQFQSKVLSKTLDNVGRGVVTPDPNLDMNQVGVPENMAWEMYKPYVLRGLVRTGYPSATAVKMVADKTDTARHILEKEMEERPIIMDRAPTWHKFNFLAFTPHITQDETIRVCPLIVSGFNMDFDGDTVNMHVPSSQKAVDQAKRIMMPSENLISTTDLSSPMHSPSKEQIFGLYAATSKVNQKPVKVFNTVSEAKRAYAAGEIEMNDPIEILQK